MWHHHFFRNLLPSSRIDRSGWRFQHLQTKKYMPHFLNLPPQKNVFKQFLIQSFQFSWISFLVTFLFSLSLSALFNQRCYLTLSLPRETKMEFLPNLSMYLQEEGWRKERNISKKDVGWLLKQKLFRAQITRNIQQTEQRIFAEPPKVPSILASSHCHGLDQNPNQSHENKEHDRKLKNLLV